MSRRKKSLTRFRWMAYCDRRISVAAGTYEEYHEWCARTGIQLSHEDMLGIERLTYQVRESDSPWATARGSVYEKKVAKGGWEQIKDIVSTMEFDDGD